MLDVRVARHPDHRVALFEDGSSWTYAECRERVRRAAAGLQALGVRKGDRVIAWLPTGMPMVLTWFATNYLGAVFVPLNTAYRGKVLEHVINSAAASVMIAHPDLVGRLRELEIPRLRHIIGADGLDGDASRLDDTAVVDHWDIQSIIYTSGTTGPSKGVLSPYLQLYTTAVVTYGYLGEGESILVNLPMFHVGGTSPTYCALVRSGMFYLVDGFSTTKFWDQVRAGNCASTSGLIGVMGAFLARSEPRPDDRDNPLKWITMMPINEQTVNLGERFGFDYISGFNMTEVSSPLVTDVNTRVFGGCGRPRMGVTCRLVDENDIEVPTGSPGELIVRTDSPWSMNAGYDGMPEATARAWRNGWFHTGDLFRRDAEGNYFFLDRIKDTVRRRGENISSFEVEQIILKHPAVLDVAAFPVTSEHSEDEVMVSVVLREGEALTAAELIGHCTENMAYYMVPRFAEFVAELPKTMTEKVEKYKLKAAAEKRLSAIWDREKAGIVLER